MKKCKRLLSVVLAFCMMVFLALPVSAAEDSEIVNEMRNGVVQVGLYYIDQSGSEHYIQGGSGFLINDQTLLTNHHVVNMSDDTKAAASQTFGVDFVNDTKLDVRVKVVVTRDVRIEATVLQSSAEMDVAILELSDPIYDRQSLELGDSSTVSESTTVYALGFPLLPELAQDVQYYTYNDVTVTNSIVSKKMQRNSTPFIQHSAKISDGNSGGPLVQVGSDGVGRVVGINSSRISVEEGYYYAMEINDVKDLLDALGVSYNSSTGGTTGGTTGETGGTDVGGTEKGETGEDTEVSEPEVVLDTAGLEAAIADAEDKQINGNYTEESEKALEEALDNAYEVVDDDATSQDLIDKAESDLKAAVQNLEEKSSMGWLIGVVIAVVVLAVIVLVVVLVNSNSKAKKARVPERMTPPDMGRPQNPSGGSQTIAGGIAVPPSTEGAGETSVLGEGRGETTVLGGGAQASAYMIRKKNNERVVVSGPSFTIGKERSRVNYCISDNTSVSRCHAKLVRRGAQYFITDMNSTNYTFVNGVKVIPGQDVALNDRDMIRIADEDFEFHMN